MLLLTTTSAIVAVVVVSRSRGAFLVSFGLMVFLPLTARWRASARTIHRWRSIALSWTAVTIVTGAGVVVLPNRLGWSASDFASSAHRLAEYQAGTGRGRVIQAETSLRMIEKNPLLGVGPGNWSVVYPIYADADDPSVVPDAFYPGPRIPRNDILSLIAEWGIAGVSLAIIFLVALVARSWHLLTSRHPQSRSAGSLVLVTLMGAVMLGIFDSVIRVAPTALLVALVVGVALGDGERVGKLRLRRSAWPQRYAWMTLVGGCTFLSLVLTWSTAQDLRALRIVNSFSSTNDLARAVAIAPNNAEARALLSFALANAGRCDLAVPHMTHFARLQPFSLLVTRLQEKCGLLRAPVTGWPF